MTTTVRHETKALLRAHLSAASPYGHLTPHCAVCSRLLRLAMESGQPPEIADANDAAMANDAADTAAPDGATLPA
ncbi:DUF6274 family protein [Streptomyces sp. NBC_01808]|uniref:DUF6274 family protein n=1 Tax=Streptomyces sp. NBC_01808 TaxID=2975947 RepID=UPI002DD7AC64|nr:DUF6274 family protein [Streptomyces sp. NBC_01808]WSA39517.1 DUF6274 family protein [Streptomyces sp. NBC_01808]